MLWKGYCFLLNWSINYTCHEETLMNNRQWHHIKCNVNSQLSLILKAVTCWAEGSQVNIFFCLLAMTIDHWLHTVKAFWKKTTLIKLVHLRTYFKHSLTVQLYCLSMFILSIIFVIVCGLWVEMNLCRVFYGLFICVLLLEIQLSKGEGWDPVIKWGGLGSSHQKERVGIQLSNGEGWDPIIKRGELGSSHQKGKVGIQLSNGALWDSVIRRGAIGAFSQT